MEYQKLEQIGNHLKLLSCEIYDFEQHIIANIIIKMLGKCVIWVLFVWCQIYRPNINFMNIFIRKSKTVIFLITVIEKNAFAITAQKLTILFSDLCVNCTVLYLAPVGYWDHSFCCLVQIIILLCIIKC